MYLLPFLIYSIFSNFAFGVIFGAIVFYLINIAFLKYNIPEPIRFYFSIFFVQIFSVFLFYDLTLDDKNSINISDGIITNLVNITLIQFLLMMLVFCMIFKKTTILNRVHLINMLEKYSFNRIVLTYLFFSLVFPTLSFLYGNNASLYQFFLTLASMKNVPLILLIFHFYLLKKNRLFILSIIVFEFFMGFISYFSSFKTILIFLLMVSMVTTNGVTFNRIIKLLPVVLIVIFSLSFWNFVKSDYRLYLRGENNFSQSIEVKKSSAFSFIYDRFNSFGAEEFEIGFLSFVGRLQYMEEYLQVVKRVPIVIKHQEGKLLKESLDFNSSLRMFNAKKSVLDPSAKTAYFTGREVTGVHDGTAISLGFFVDFFIDFGFLGMIVPLIFLTSTLAFFFRWIYRNIKYDVLFNLAFLISVVTSIGTFESDLIFFIGIFRNYLVFYFVCDLFFFKSLYKYIMK